MTKSIKVNGVERIIEVTEEAVFIAREFHNAIEKMDDPVFKNEISFNMTSDQISHINSGIFETETVRDLRNLVSNTLFICDQDEAIVVESALIKQETTRRKHAFIHNLLRESLDLLH